MSDRKDTPLAAHTIPANYQNGVNIAGFHFRPRFIIEGIILAFVSGAVFFGVFLALPFMNFGSRLGYTLALGAIGFLAGAKGINDEPLSEFIGNWLSFRKKRRTAYYNPRVKLESVPYSEILHRKEENSALNKAISFREKIKNGIIEKSNTKTEKKMRQSFFDAERMYFADDEGIIEKPTEYMDDREYREAMKKEAKRERELLKKAKELERKRRYENG